MNNNKGSQKEKKRKKKEKEKKQLKKKKIKFKILKRRNVKNCCGDSMAKGQRLIIFTFYNLNKIMIMVSVKKIIINIHRGI